MHNLVVYMFCVMAFVWAQDDSPNLQQLETNIKKQIPALADLNQSALPAMEDLQNAIKAKCLKNSGEGAFERVQAAKDELVQCMLSHFNVTILSSEIEEAKKSGSMEVVFARYCKKTPIIKTCVTQLTDEVTECLEEREKKNLNITIDIADNFAEYMCMKDGDRLAMFIAEGGVDCLESQQENIQKCLNSTFGHRIPANITIGTLPLLVFDAEQCSDYEKTRSCVVNELERCKERSPANIIDSVFKYIKKISPCQPTPSAAVNRIKRDPIPDANMFQHGPSSPFDFQNVLNDTQLKKRCEKNGGPNAYQEAEAALKQVTSCMMTNLPLIKQMMAQALSSMPDGMMAGRSKRNLQRQPFTEINQDAFIKLCLNIHENISKCHNDDAKAKMKACLDPKESYMPDFMFGAIDNALNYSCGKGLKLLKSETIMEGVECMMMAQMQPNHVKSCANKTKLFTMDNDIIPKDQFCSDLKAVGDCTTQYNDEHCKNSKNYNKFMSGLLMSIQEPCGSSYVHYSSLLLLSVSLLFSYVRTFNY